MGMPQSDDFISAIVNDPENDGLRLIYADWLDEHGGARLLRPPRRRTGRVSPPGLCPAGEEWGGGAAAGPGGPLAPAAAYPSGGLDRQGGRTVRRPRSWRS